MFSRQDLDEIDFQSIAREVKEFGEWNLYCYVNLMIFMWFLFFQILFLFYLLHMKFLNLTVNSCWIQWPGFSTCVMTNWRASHIFSQWLRLISGAYLLELSKQVRWIQLYISVTDQKCSTALVLTIGHLTIVCSNYIGCQLLPSFLPKLTAYSAKLLYFRYNWPE